MEYRCSIAWIRANRRQVRPENGRGGKISAAHGVRRDCRRVCRSQFVAKLLPGEKEKRFVVPVVELGNPDRPAKRSTVIVLFVGGPGVSRQTGSISSSALRTIEIVEPGVRVQVLVPEDFVGRAMEVVGP